jgi:hypothetical protein
MGKRPPPQCLAIIICEDVVEDARSHNKCILNTYNTIFSQHYPAKHDRLTIFLSFTNGHGEVPIEVRFGKEGKKPILNARGKVKFEDPLAVAELILNLRHVPIPEAGTYEVQVVVDEDHILCQRRVRATLVPSS